MKNKDNKILHLTCPMCRKSFETTRRDKIWCSIECRTFFYKTEEMIKENKQRQERMKDDRYYYNGATRKFYLKALMPKKGNHDS